jgi:hypothetical protein
MPPYYLQLLDFPGNYEKGSHVYGPRAYVAIRASSPEKGKDKSGNKELDFTVISADCYSFSEFESEANKLIKELETIKKQAKKFFRKEKEKRLIKKN